MSLKELLRTIAKAVPALAYPFRRWRIRYVLYADVAKLLPANSLGPAPKKVLFATSLGAEAVAGKIEAVLAGALHLRGVEPHFFFCDRALPACQLCMHGGDEPSARRFVEKGPDAYFHCGSCYPGPADILRSAGAIIHTLSQSLDPDAINIAKRIASETQFAEIASFRHGSVAVGEHAMAGALRYFSRAQLDGEPLAEEVLRRYFEASLLTTFALRKLFASEKFESVVLHHGIYVPQGLIAEVTREANVRLVVWVVAYRKQRFIFSHDDTYHHTLISEPASQWDRMKWTGETEAKLLSYLQSRKTGANDWINFAVERAGPEQEQLFHKLDLDPKKPVILLLTNVLWDAQLHYPANAYPNILAWIFDSVRLFAERPDLQLVIRVHPAEITGQIRSRQLVTDELAKEFPQLPANVRVVGPQDNISTYALFDISNAALIYGTKTGVELTAAGIPTIVAGEAWIRGKGITFDANSPQEYRSLVARLPFPGRNEPNLVERARKYAYHFFFRRMIPVNFLQQTSGWPPYQVIATRDKLAPLEDAGLDVICEGILTGSPFVYPAEELDTAATKGAERDLLRS